MKIKDLFESQSHKAIAEVVASELNAEFKRQNIKAKAECIGGQLVPGRYFVKVNIDISGQNNVQAAYSAMKDYLEKLLPEDNLIGINYDLVLSAFDRYHIYFNQVD
jgi:hypothetical protein